MESGRTSFAAGESAAAVGHRRLGLDGGLRIGIALGAAQRVLVYRLDGRRGGLGAVIVVAYVADEIR